MKPWKQTSEARLSDRKLKKQALGLRTRPAVGRFAAHSVEPFAAAVAEQDALSALQRVALAAHDVP